MAKFNAAQQIVGYDPHLSYNVALCYYRYYIILHILETVQAVFTHNLKKSYRLKDFAPALKHIADIIERGIREHPELSVGMQTEGIEVYHQNLSLCFQIFLLKTYNSFNLLGA